jgi:hypothetical protein
VDGGEAAGAVAGGRLPKDKGPRVRRPRGEREQEQVMIMTERNLRKYLARRGCRLFKSRQRDPRCIDHDTYMVVDMDNRCVVDDRARMGLDEVTSWARAQNAPTLHQLSQLR